MIEPLQEIVVYLTLGECDQYPGTRCVLEAYGPFASESESEAFMEASPKEFAPHRIFLKPPSWARHPRGSDDSTTSTA